MNRYIALLLALGLVTAAAHGQSRVDSLNARLAGASGHDRVRVLVELMRAQQAEGPRALAQGHEALSILNTAPDPALRADVLYFLGAAHYNLNAPDSALLYAVQARDLAAEVVHARDRERSDAADVRMRLGQAERYIGHVESFLGRYDDALASYTRAYQVFERMGERRRMADAVNDMAVVAKTKGDFQQALLFHDKAIVTFEELGLEAETANVLHGQGIVYSHMGRYDDALQSFFRALEIREARGDRLEMAGTMVNIGGTYQYLEDYRQSLTFYGRARAIYEATGVKRSLATVLTNIGSVHVLLGHPDQARETFARARELATETRNERLLAYIHQEMGGLHESQGDLALARMDYEAALTSFEALGDRRGIVNALLAVGRVRGGPDGIERTLRARDLAREMESHLLLRDAYSQLSDLYAAAGRYPEALDAYRLYKASHDSLFNAESHSTIARLETEYRSREQEQQIALLEQQRQVERLWLTGLLGGLGLFGVITLLSFNRARHRKRALVAQRDIHRVETERAWRATGAADARNRLLEAENKRRADELEAARRLQLSLLPREICHHSHAEIVTFMRTATEVGGDYYDYSHGPDGALTIAIGDATGHGTPAGTLVAAVKSLFSTYADEPDLTRALERSARALRRMALPQLYMALALVRMTGLRLELAGAGMPPAVIFRAASGAIETVPLKGMPLGAPMDYPYEKKEVTLAPDDLFVLMSDGLPELRDPAGAELGYERISEIVRQVGHLDAHAVKDHLVRTVEAWAGGSPIGDDITFIVVRMRDEATPAAILPGREPA
jgi:serine phosphatase RsbU (regulator of sigma subunit)